MNKKIMDEIKELCYGREDLMRVSESIATYLGDINIAEDLCDVMATAAVNFIAELKKGKTYSVTNY